MEERKRPTVLTVTQALNWANSALESVTLTLVGEVSEVNDKRGYKAAYFTVKDDASNLPCKIWRNRYESTGVKLRVGLRVRLSGRFSVYARTGRMTFDVFSIVPEGEGELRLKVAELARRLAAEGLTAEERKRPVPKYCERIGLVTSPRGAAVRDVLRTLRERFPVARVLFAGVPVEGRDAPRDLCRALDAVVAAGAEVVLLVRGGGSFEDLMPFNDEQLARAVAACPVPVITGIGHEPDTSIADLVADVRAATPTAAAAAASPKRDNLAVGFAHAASRMMAALGRQLEGERARLDALADRPVMREADVLLANPAQGVDLYAGKLERAGRLLAAPRRAQVDSLAVRLDAAIPQNVRRDAAALSAYGSALDAAGKTLGRAQAAQADALAARLQRAAERSLSRRQAAVDARLQDLRGAGKMLLARHKAAFGLAASRLDDLSPLAVIHRGYALVRDDAGGIVDSVDQVQAGQKVAVTVADGVIAATVDGVDRTEIVLIDHEEDQ